MLLQFFNLVFLLLNSLVKHLKIYEASTAQKTQFVGDIFLCLFQKLFPWCHLIFRGAHLIIEETVHIKNLWEGLKKMAP